MITELIINIEHERILKETTNICLRDWIRHHHAT